jgi:hypothetical protein
VVAHSGLSVLTSVEFNSKPQCRTIKIKNVTTCWMLAAKVGIANLAVPQAMPQPPFDISFIAPEFSGNFGFFPRAVEARHGLTPTRLAIARRPPPFRGR